MKILPLVENINADITATGNKIKRASRDGYNIADRTASIYKQNSAIRYLNITRSVCDKVKKGITLKELPYAAAVVGTLSPFLFGGVLFFCLGLIARYTIPKVTDFYSKIKPSESESGTDLYG